MRVFSWSKKLDIKHNLFLNAFKSGWGIASCVWISVMVYKSQVIMDNLAFKYILPLILNSIFLSKLPH